MGWRNEEDGVVRAHETNHHYFIRYTTVQLSYTSTTDYQSWEAASTTLLYYAYSITLGTLSAC